MSDTSEEHHELVGSLLDRLKKNGEFSGIRADYEGWERPSEIESISGDESRKPDVIADHGEERHLFVVETCTALRSESTRDRWKAFYDHSKTGGRFVVCVPKRCALEAEQWKNEIGMPDLEVWRLPDSKTVS